VTVSELLSKTPKPVILGLALVLIVAIGAVDYLSGTEVSISILYLLPISMVAWWVGRRPGILAAVMASASWLAADLLSSRVYSVAAIPYWNAAVRLGFFLIVSEALAALQTSRVRQNELSQFIVHDLRAPLGNVISGLEALEQVSEGQRDETQTLLIQTAMSSSNRMLTLIDSLLDLARLEHRSMPVNPVDADVKEIVETSLQQVVNTAAQRELVLLCDLSEPGLRIHADPDLTIRVIVNLLTNAMRVSQPQASVIAKAGRMDDDRVWISVSDSGPGIPEKWLDKIFDKFGQIDARKTGGFKGSGLGLAFCRRAVEAQGGRIWLESKVNRGTTVTFTLPAASRGSADREGPPPAP
jgi:signal transduction histidine kinase